MGGKAMFGDRFGAPHALVPRAGFNRTGSTLTSTRLRDCRHLGTRIRRLLRDALCKCSLKTEDHYLPGAITKVAPGAGVERAGEATISRPGEAGHSRRRCRFGFCAGALHAHTPHSNARRFGAQEQGRAARPIIALQRSSTSGCRQTVNADSDFEHLQRGFRNPFTGGQQSF